MIGKLLPQFFVAVLFIMTAVAQAQSSSDYHVVTLEKDRPLYCQKSSNLLTRVTTLAKGKEVWIPRAALPELFDLESGERDTSGFYGNVVVNGLALPNKCLAGSSFYITALIPIAIEDGIIEAMTPATSPRASYQKVYRSSGQVNSSEGTIAWGIGRNKKRFSKIWNKSYGESDLSLEEREKSRAVLEELARFADRTTATPANLLYLGGSSASENQRVARELSVRTIDDYGFSPAYGAWDVAIYGTATRLGFAHAPCAEFVSEVIRQAYTRAGYGFDEDFKDSIKERLIFTPWQDNIFGPQAVRGLADRLALAGWIPWDPSVYKPVTGAIGMALDAWTPGHTYLIAGERGTFIVDNGNPRGLDLRLSTLALNRFKDMYGHGVFFLPPGITPPRW